MILIIIVGIIFDVVNGSVTFLPVFGPYLMLIIIFIFIICLKFDAVTRSVPFFTSLCFLSNTDNDNNNFWYCIQYGDVPLYNPFFCLFDDLFMVPCSVLIDGPDVGAL